MIIQDLFGFVRRNNKKWTIVQIKKMLAEINQIKTYLERVLKEREVA